MLTIMLATMLLNAITVFGYGVVRNYKVNAGRFYGYYYGMFANVSEEQLSDISLRSEFADVGVAAVVGSTEGEDQSNLALYYMDDMARTMTNQINRLTEGRFPENAKEIAGYRSFFAALGMETPKLGDTVTMQYRRNLHSPYEPAQFVISGFLEEPEKSQHKMRMAFVSQDYYKQSFAQEERSYTMYFTLDESVPVNGGNGEEIIQELAKDCGLDPRYAADNFLYLNWAFNPGMDVILGCAAVGLIVVVFAVLVIYNIFQVGIARKVQEYGKIKALGVTKRQMKGLIFREGMMLAAFSVPAGLVAGYFAGKLFIDSGVRRQSEMGLEAIPVSGFSLPLELFVVLVSLFTVWIALKRPMRAVASISPVEAMRYQELPGSRKQQKVLRKGRKNMSVMGLTLANLSAHRGRTISTIVTLGLSCVLFMVMANLGGSLDAEYDARREIPYGDFQLELDYSLNDTVYPENNLDAILSDNPLNDSFLERIRRIEGVKEVKTQGLLCFTGEEGMRSVEVLDRESFEREQGYGNCLGEFTYEQAVQEQGILYGWSYFMEENGYELGQEMDLELSDGTKEAGYQGRILGSFGALNANWAITDQTCEALGLDEASCGIAWIICEEGMKEQVQAELEELVSGTGHMEMKSYENQLAESKAGISMMRTIAYALSIFIAVISFLNMANTLITSSITRKQEFGVLQAVGMTNAQLNLSMQAEGLLFTVGTVAVTLLVGIPAGYALFCYAKSISMIGISVYHFPAAETVLMVLVLAVFQGTLSLILSKNIKKESLIERIRYHG